LGAIAAAVLVEAFTSWLDNRLFTDGRPPQPFDRGGSEDIRAVLTTIASSTVTVLALVLSMTMVVISLAATQLGPRLIRSFLSSRVLKSVISIYAGLFVYSLLVLDSINSDEAAGPQLLPNIGTTICLLWATGAVLALIWYVHHVAWSIQLPQVVANIAANLTQHIEATRTEREFAAGDRDPVEVEREWSQRTPSSDVATLVVGVSGYVQQIDHQPLVDAATRGNAVVSFLVRPGDFVTSGDRIAEISPASALEAMTGPVEADLDVGPHRTLDQDLEFAIDQLVEIALRALSPAINDTFTGLTCLDWIGTALRSLGTIPVDRSIHCDGTGAIRVVERPRSWGRLVQAGYSKIRQTAAADNPAVAIRILESITRLVPTATSVAHRAALIDEADMCVAQAATGNWVSSDLVALATRHQALQALLDPPEPGPAPA